MFTIFLVVPFFIISRFPRVRKRLGPKTGFRLFPALLLIWLLYIVYEINAEKELGPNYMPSILFWPLLIAVTIVGVGSLIASTFYFLRNKGSASTKL